MKSLALLTAVVWTLGFAYAPPEKFTFVDLEPHANQKIKDDLGSLDGNNLAALLQSGRTFEGVNFKFDKGVVQLNSKQVTQKRPNKVEGIKVGKACVKVHILHACEFGNAEEGNAIFVADGTKVAEYKIVYDDGTSASIPVVYGEDVRDWWFNAGAKGVSRGKVAWKGTNEAAKNLNCQIRLYLTSWDNPHPAKKIATIDYIKIGDSAAAPFCVAITLEAK
jgi:hypothetical protein